MFINNIRNIKNKKWRKRKLNSTSCTKLTRTIEEILKLSDVEYDSLQKLLFAHNKKELRQLHLTVLSKFYVDD